MKRTQHGYISSSKWHALTALMACLTLSAIAVPADATRDEAGTIAVVETSYPAVMLAKSGKGLDKGTFEVLQMATLPAAWVWVEDDTVDGLGVEYWAVHSTFTSPGPQNPSVDMTFEYLPGASPGSLQDFVAFIVAGYPHVNSPGELQIYRSDAGPAGP